MTPEALPDIIAVIASHRLAIEAVDDPAVPAALVDLLDSGRDAAASELGDRLLEGVRAWLTAAGVSGLADQDPYLDALVESLALRDHVTPEMPPLSEEEAEYDEGVADDFGQAIMGEDFELPGSFIVAATPAGSEVDVWFIPLHERPEPIH